MKKTIVSTVNKTSVYPIIFVFCITASVISCKPDKELNEVITDEHFNSLFIRKGGGFTGGDGTYSVKLPDGRSVWIFGDTFLGQVEEDGSRKKMDPIYIRNSFVIQDGDNLTTLHQNINGRDHSTVIPPHVLDSDFEITETEQWYWPGDGLIENNELKVFMSEFHQTGSGMWDFQWKNTALASFSLPDLKLIDITYFSFPNNNIHWGHAVFEDDEYTYIYGLGNGKPYAARAASGSIYGQWEFYTAEGWSKNHENCTPIADIDGSEQFSILKWKGKYIFITQLGGLSDQICSFTSDKPFSDWGNKQVIYKTPLLPENNKNIFTYNAVAHPQFIENNSILVSYNTNSFELEDHFKDAGIYRPRFIRVPLKIIDPGF